MLDLTQDWSKLPGRTELRKMRAGRSMSEPPSPDLQRRWKIPDKLVLRAAVSGRSAREAAAVKSGFASDIENFAQQAIEVIEAGAVSVHLDLGGIIPSPDYGDYPAMQGHYEKIIELISAGTKKDWVRDVNILHGKNFQDNVMPITSGIGETTVFAPDNPVDWMEAVAKVVTDCGKRLFLVAHSPAEVELMERHIIRKGILEKPYCFSILIGYPFDERMSSRIATSMPNPKAMIQELTIIVDRIREIDPDAYITVTCAGRAAQYMAVLAILMGLNVRMGTEDTIWRYPHKDEILTNAVENVKRTRVIAEQLGRELATAEEYRQIIGLKKMS